MSGETEFGITIIPVRDLQVVSKSGLLCCYGLGAIRLLGRAVQHLHWRRMDKRFHFSMRVK